MNVELCLKQYMQMRCVKHVILDYVIGDTSAKNTY